MSRLDPNGCPDAQKCIDVEGQSCGGRGMLTLWLGDTVVAEEPLCPRINPDEASLNELMGSVGRRGNCTEAAYDAAKSKQLARLTAELPSVGRFVLCLPVPELISKEAITQ